VVPRHKHTPAHTHARTHARTHRHARTHAQACTNALTLDNPFSPHMPAPGPSPPRRQRLPLRQTVQYTSATVRCTCGLQWAAAYSLSQFRATDCARRPSPSSRSAPVHACSWVHAPPLPIGCVSPCRGLPRRSQPASKRGPHGQCGADAPARIAVEAHMGSAARIVPRVTQHCIVPRVTQHCNMRSVKRVTPATAVSLMLAGVVGLGGLLRRGYNHSA
jgi:hypothetical protein